MQKITLHVSGTHCQACKIYIEDTLNEYNGIYNTTVDLQQKTVSFETDLDTPTETLVQSLTRRIQNNGYILSVEKTTESQKSGVLWQAVPIGLSVLTVFFLIQKSGILNFGFGGNMTPATSFTIGLIASVSSCLAVVGGLVLSLSATVSQDNVPDKKPMMLFHGGRLFGFAILGGLLGSIGDIISVSLTTTTILGMIAATVMIILGLNLLGIFQKHITLPANTFTFFRQIEHKTLAPLFVGVGTFFLPCGFTQAMQVVALSSGSFISGSLIMSAFALGTLPMLTLLSFGSTSFAQSKYAHVFFASAGVVVIGLGLFSLLSALAGLGIIRPMFTI